MTGQSFLNHQSHRKEAYGARDLWDEIEEKSRSISTDRWKYIRNDKPEVPYDAHQAYLEFYRPAVHVMRTMKANGELNPDQLTFFEDTKSPEELYDLKNDPFELHNLAYTAAYADKLAEMRSKIAEYDQAMTPMSDIYQPEHPISVDVMEWLIKEHPEAYEEMKSGIEIGFHKYTKAYNEAMKKN